MDTSDDLRGTLRTLEACVSRLETGPAPTGLLLHRGRARRRRRTLLAGSVGAIGLALGVIVPLASAHTTGSSPSAASPSGESGSVSGPPEFHCAAQLTSSPLHDAGEPGTRTPEEAVAPFLRDGETSTVEDQSAEQALVVATTGAEVSASFSLLNEGNGWFVSTIVRCLS